ncbi:MAG TPA: PipX family protein [Allocoleopsis sp.]
MKTETYLNHPTFGLLYRICILDDNQELFTTLYAQRLFFIVNSRPNGITFETIGRNDSRLLVENRLRSLRRLGALKEYNELQTFHKQTFS